MRNISGIDSSKGKIGEMQSIVYDKELNRDCIEELSGANRCWSSDEGEADGVETYDILAGLSGMVSPSASNSNGQGTIQGSDDAKD
jgi:hypothetical protein